jgi:hypothetical protein
MATSFMIQFAVNGKPCYANVYASGSTPKEYHVHIVNTPTSSGLPDHIVLEEINEKLCLRSANGALDGELKQIVEEIQKHEQRK